MSPNEKANWKAINTILWKDWDPIGAGAPEDEYSDFVWPVYRLLAAGAGRDMVALYLRAAARDKLGVDAVDEPRVNVMLDKLMALKITEANT